MATRMARSPWRWVLHWQPVRIGLLTSAPCHLAQVSIGLPTFLLQEQNKKLVLLAYWLGIVIFVPLGVWLW